MWILQQCDPHKAIIVTTRPVDGELRHSRRDSWQETTCGYELGKSSTYPILKRELN